MGLIRNSSNFEKKVKEVKIIYGVNGIIEDLEVGEYKCTK